MYSSKERKEMGRQEQDGHMEKCSRRLREERRRREEGVRGQREYSVVEVSNLSVICDCLLVLLMLLLMLMLMLLNAMELTLSFQGC